MNRALKPHSFETIAVAGVADVAVVAAVGTAGVVVAVGMAGVVEAVEAVESVEAADEYMAAIVVALAEVAAVVVALANVAMPIEIELANCSGLQAMAAATVAAVVESGNGNTNGVRKEILST